MASLSTEAIQEFGSELIDFYSVHIGKGSFNTDPWYKPSKRYNISWLSAHMLENIWFDEIFRNSSWHQDTKYTFNVKVHDDLEKTKGKVNKEEKA